MKREKVIRLRVNEGEYAIVQALAAYLHRTMSDAIREAVRRVLTQVADKERRR